MTFSKNLVLSSLIALPLALVGCGGGSGGSDDDTVAFTLAISDAPVDNLSAVYVCFGDIELKGNADNENNVFNNADALVGTTITLDNGDVEVISACTDEEGNEVSDSVSLNLLNFTGSDSINLLAGEEIHVGEYSQIRLDILPYSYALENDEQVPVRVPSNELKLDGFTATQGNNVSYTIEFDLRKGMTDPVGQEGYILKPRGVRLVDNNLAGHINGQVDELLLTAENGCDINKTAFVYLYQGHELALNELADFGGDSTLNQPITSVGVHSDIIGQGPFSYEIGFVSVGDYSLALTCSDDADPEGRDELLFIKKVETQVEEKQTATADFLLN